MKGWPVHNIAIYQHRMVYSIYKEKEGGRRGRSVAVFVQNYCNSVSITGAEANKMMIGSYTNNTEVNEYLGKANSRLKIKSARRTHSVLRQASSPLGSALFFISNP